MRSYPSPGNPDIRIWWCRSQIIQTPCKSLFHCQWDVIYIRKEPSFRRRHVNSFTGKVCHDHETDHIWRLIASRRVPITAKTGNEVLLRERTSAHHGTRVVRAVSDQKQSAELLKWHGFHVTCPEGIACHSTDISTVRRADLASGIFQFACILALRRMGVSKVLQR